MINSSDDVEIKFHSKNCIDNDMLVFGIQKAMLLTLLERSKINQQQYDYAIRLLEEALKQ